jgi:hypothetical protein
VVLAVAVMVEPMQLLGSTDKQTLVAVAAAVD